MSPFVAKALQLLLSLSILIVLHELGHFIPAKIFKTRVEKFFLFFDVKFALFKKKIGETVYGIGWLPLGGYVKISGMIDESMDKEQMAQPPQPWEFRSKPAWQRLIIMIGGVTVNIILGFLIYMMILNVWGEDELLNKNLPQGMEVAEVMQPYGFQNGDRVVAINGKEIENAEVINKYLSLRNVKDVTVKHQSGQLETLQIPDSIGTMLFHKGVYMPFTPRMKPQIDTVVADMPAGKGGLQKNDIILAINEQPIKYYDEVRKVVEPNAEKPLTFKVDRAGEIKELTITPDSIGKIGVYPVGKDVIDAYTNKKYTFLESIPAGFDKAYWTLHDYVAQLKYLFTKKGASQVGGFGTIAKLFPPVWDWQSFWETTALISIILAFMNILPIPALDGGHVLFLLYEIITGRKPSEKFLEYAQMVGFFILLALLLYANGNDIYRAITN
ncbi:RIP metalloprotease RseP [Zhouia sp. PK063]|uniref:RIP metalloprotease RseP n=1 Tax=Zhouia sp. PK063 TaxID=3373602 RepID=UPI00379AF15B